MSIIEELVDRVSARSLLILLGVSFVLWRIYVRADESMRLRRLGGARASKAPTKFPFSIDIVYGQVKATMAHKNYEWFVEFMKGAPTWDVESRVLGRRVILTANPENIKAILATQFDDFGKGALFHREWSEFLGDSIFTTDGHKWHASRHLIRSMFIKERISDLHCFESHLETLFRAIANGGALDGENQEVDVEAGNGRPVEISDLFFRYTLDVATDFLLGKDVQSLTTLRQPFADAFNEVQRVQNILSRAGALRPLVSRRSFRAGLRTVNEFLNTYIDQTLRLGPEELASKTKSDVQGYTFLHELASFTRDRKVIRDQLIAVLLAGRDTTAATLSWAFYELGRHPEVVRRLRAEVLDQVGPNRPPTYRDIKDMKYLQNVMNETLRLYPAVPFNVRLALRDTLLPTGGGPNGDQPVPVLKDTSIAYSTIAMQRRADLYPSSSAPLSDEKAAAAGAAATMSGPDDFDPGRWYHWQPKPWQYVPFNGGPRICIGQQFALTEMGYVLTRMMQKFERVESFMHEVDGGHPTLKAEIVLQPGDGVKVALWEARQQ
ncbi:hypothetical protein SLS62_010515 [Diatrype stigma]|uniref:Cytochrome P450 52A13 n=1 Tax=Diatrype stigma TaxID=117547 RepID=A0AAN9U9Z1_9PEZI